MLSSQFDGRGAVGSNRVAPPSVPKLRLPLTPISLYCALPPESSADPLPSRSVHVLVSSALRIGFTDCAMLSSCDTRHLPVEALMAVLPVPNRSYEPPTRMAQSFQHGRHVIAFADRSGTNRPAGAF